MYIYIYIYIYKQLSLKHHAEDMYFIPDVSVHYTIFKGLSI